MLINYALSLWIANLGVVPLFSFAFLRALPELFAFIFLLVRVCIVLEPINISLSYRINIYFRKRFLSLSSQLVKVFVIIIASQNIYASSDIFLSKGEQTEISVNSLKSFSVGNNEVIKYKYRPNLRSILIKAKSLGFTDLVVWENASIKHTFNIYVTSKKAQLKQMQLIKALNKTNMQTRISGELVEVTGVVKTLSEYFIIKSIQANEHKNIIINVSIEKKLINQIIANVYSQLYENGVQYVRCFQQDINIQCEFSDPQNSAELKSLENKYFIKFTSQINQVKNVNYNLHFQIVSLETHNNVGLSSGIDKIEFELANSLKTNQINLNSGNFLLKNENYSAHLISSPQIVSIVDKEFKLALGSEIPFRSIVSGQEMTQWKFAGLQLKGKMILLNGKLALELNSQITSPSEQQITGPEGNTTLYLDSEKLQRLFSINIEVKDQVTNSIPLIKEIPILKEIFSTQNELFTHKKILCYVTLEEIKHE